MLGIWKHLFSKKPGRDFKMGPTVDEVYFYKKMEFFSFMKRIIPLALIFFVVVLSAGGCTSSEEADPAGPSPDETVEDVNDEVAEEDELLEEPGQAVRSGRLTLFSDDGSTRWIVKSQEAVDREAGDTIVFDPVTASVLQEYNFENERVFEEEMIDIEISDYDLESELGVYDPGAGRLEFQGNTIITSEDLKLTSQLVVWEQDDNVIYSPEYTEISGRDFKARAHSFTAPGTLDKISLYGDEDEPARIRWEESE